MSKWKVQYAPGFKSRFQRYKKKRPAEVKAVLVNLDKYLSALNDGVPPREIRAGFIHPETHGVTAIDQKGVQGRLAETRLYIYMKDFTLYLITIGDKRSQRDDINLSKRFVDELRGGK